jgi:hypothetical protein
MSFRKGLLSVVQRTLFVHPSHSPNLAQTPLARRGPGYRFPTDSSFCPLDLNELQTNPVTADEIASSVELFYAESLGQATPTAICFGGGFCEPLDDLPLALSSIVQIREARHGVPVVVQTSGVGGVGAEELGELDKELREAPGSDGISKLQVWVDLAASNPPAYDKVMGGTMSKAAFGQVCSFISGLVESGVTVYGVGTEHPAANIKEMKSLSGALGCAGFFARSYHAETLYDVLGVEKGASNDELKDAYFTKSKALHPDVAGDAVEAGAMEKVTEAYGVLRDEEKRRLYDEEYVADLVLNENEEDFYAAVSAKSM